MYLRQKTNYENLCLCSLLLHQTSHFEKWKDFLTSVSACQMFDVDVSYIIAKMLLNLHYLTLLLVCVTLCVFGAMSCDVSACMSEVAPGTLEK